MLDPLLVQQMIEQGLLPGSPTQIAGDLGQGMRTPQFADILRRMRLGTEDQQGEYRNPWDTQPESAPSWAQSAGQGAPGQGTGNINYMGRGQTFNVSPKLQAAFAKLFGKTGGGSLLGG